jgi:carbonic anhydrase
VDEERSGEFERILAENERYTEAFDRSRLSAAPLSGLAVVACMDARLDVEEALGLRTGDAHHRLRSPRRR